MSSRDEILARVRRNVPGPRPLPALPSADAAGRRDAFAAALAAMGGSVFEPAAGADPDAAVRERHPEARVIVSATPEASGTRALDPAAAPAALHDVDVGVVRAAFGVAETGSVFLSEAELGVNALAFLSQHLVALLDPADLVADLHAAYRRAEFRGARYALLLTGPSATADIEGVLIRGAQGIRSLTVVFAARGHRPGI